jgi:hypothetical protein
VAAEAAAAAAEADSNISAFQERLNDGGRFFLPLFLYRLYKFFIQEFPIAGLTEYMLNDCIASHMLPGPMPLPNGPGE